MNYENSVASNYEAAEVIGQLTSSMGQFRIGTLDVHEEKERAFQNKLKCTEKLRKIEEEIVDLEKKISRERIEWEENNHKRYYMPPSKKNKPNRVEALNKDTLEISYSTERLKWEAENLKRYEPFYKKRYAIINGATEGEGLPGFWLRAMMKNKMLAEEITELDEKALNYLTNIRWDMIDNSGGFKLEFFFNRNPYFENDILTKTYYMIVDEESVRGKTIGTQIKWHSRKSMTQNLVLKSRKTNLVTKTVESPSFFHLFDSTQFPPSDVDAGRLRWVIPQDYEIGLTIRDKIIPHAISWYTGDAADTNDEGYKIW